MRESRHQYCEMGKKNVNSNIEKPAPLLGSDPRKGQLKTKEIGSKGKGRSTDAALVFGAIAAVALDVIEARPFVVVRTAREAASVGTSVGAVELW